MNKHELRKKAKEIRSKLDIKRLSKKLVDKLAGTEEYKNAKNIMIYYPLSDEINLLAILKNTDKNFYLPKIDGENLLCCPYKEGDETCLSSFKTCEPLTEPCDKSLIDLVILPALGVDKNNYRLGYGGGFYDRFLEDYNGIKIVCIPSELVFDTVHPKDYDIKADIILTA